jgi:hypothetical protein
MNRNKKRMKFEATHLNEAQQCEIIAKLSKWVLGPEYEINEGAIWKVWNNHVNILQRISCCESLLRYLLNLKVLLTSKALMLYTTLSSTSTTNCFAPMFKRKRSNICMMNYNDHLRCFNETLTKWH